MNFSKNISKWNGIFTALVTPFKDSGDIDLSSYRVLLAKQKEAKVSGVIVCGTTGESPTLSKSEKELLIQTALEELRGSGVLVIAGTGSNCTEETLDFSIWASKTAVDGILIVTPYYNKPSQEGLVSHFKKIADAVACDVIPYNVPSRTGISLTPESIVTLSKHTKITAIKEATGNLSFASDIIDCLRKNDTNLDLLSGDDLTFLPFLSIGGTGIISVASNLIPKEMIQLYQYYKNGEITKAALLHQRYYPFFRDLFIESNPVPIKNALFAFGICQKKVREPLVGMGLANEKKLLESMDRAGIKK